MGLTLAAAEWGGEFDGALDDINALFSFPALFWQDVAGGLFAVNRTTPIAWFMTLVAMTILLGVYPSLVTDIIGPSVADLLAGYRTALLEAENAVRLAQH